jgi:DNA-binding MarR family transcriptional regulator
MSIEKFDTFLSLMEKNWPDAYQTMAPSMPRIDKIQSINAVRRSKIMAEYGLQGSDFGLLTALRRSPAPYLLTPTQLMAHMLISSGGLTKTLHRLETKAMIARKESPDDGRIKLVQLTAKGKRVIEEVVTKEQANHKILCTIFSRQEADQLDALLSRLLNALETSTE